MNKHSNMRLLRDFLTLCAKKGFRNFYNKSFCKKLGEIRRASETKDIRKVMALSAFIFHCSLQSSCWYIKALKTKVRAIVVPDKILER